MSAGFLKMLPINYLFTSHKYYIYIYIYIYKQDLILNDLQGMIFHKTQSHIYISCLPILSLIRSSIRMSCLTLGWNEFKKAPHFSPSNFGPN